ncbi:MAG TPA: hypothetical protein VE843_11535 [Ktedonobacteraceae bacterium]|nr:hypothetical protein [Ktedonobacteraceae bacterium]
MTTTEEVKLLREEVSRLQTELIRERLLRAEKADLTNRKGQKLAKLPKFSGKGDPRVKEWLFLANVHIKVEDIPEQQKILWAVTYLERDAFDWWRMQCQIDERATTQMTWREFQAALKEAF